tara:strand:+ start:569 stop:1222 length:654 start_codon:yes stop_codon:yes gene_type:complete
MENIFKSYNTLLESSDIERLKKIFVRYELFKLSENIPGDIVEAGVFKGTGHLYWLKLLKIFDQNSIKKVVGFDTFTKFPETTKNFERKAAKEFTKEAKYKIEKNLISKINNKVKALGCLNRSELIKGDITKTSVKYCKKNRGFKISLLHLDLDTYAGTKAALENFFPLVSKGGVVVFDEYGVRGWGETEAADEYFSKFKYTIQKIKNSLKPTAYLVK